MGFAAGAAAVVGFLIVLHASTGFNRPSGTPEKIAGLANWAAVAFASFAMFRAAAVERGRGRTPWLLLALSGCVFVVAESLRFYCSSLLAYEWPYIWIVVLVAYGLVTAGLIVKFADVAKSTRSLWRSLIVVGAFLSSLFGIIMVYEKVLTARSIPPLALTLTIIVPIADSAIVLLAVYIAATYGRGVLGRPWVAFAVAAALSGLGDLSYFFAGYARPVYAHLLTDILTTSTAAGYLAVALGALYQRLVISGGPVSAHAVRPFSDG